MRKTLLSAFTVIICFCLSAAAFAEFDLSGMKIDELNELINAAQNEILAKGGDAVIAKGKYTVGTDFAAGTYELKISDESRMAASYYIRDVEGMLIEEGHMNYGEWEHITLRTGQTIELSAAYFIRKGTRVGF